MRRTPASIKPKNRWKAKKLLDVWQNQYQAPEVQQALISLIQEITWNNSKNHQIILKRSILANAFSKDEFEVLQR